MKDTIFKTVTALVLILLIAPLALASQTRKINLNVVASPGTTFYYYSVLFKISSPPKETSIGGKMLNANTLPAGQYNDAFDIYSRQDIPFGGNIYINISVHHNGHVPNYLNANFIIKNNGRLAYVSDSSERNHTLKSNGEQATPLQVCAITLSPGTGSENDTINITC